MGANEHAIALCAQTRMQYELAGFPPTVVQAAIKRAMRTAEEKARPISDDIRDRAYLDLLAHELANIKPWLDGTMKTAVE